MFVNLEGKKANIISKAFNYFFSLLFFYQFVDASFIL